MKSGDGALDTSVVGVKERGDYGAAKPGNGCEGNLKRAVAKVNADLQRGSRAPTVGGRKMDDR